MLYKLFLFLIFLIAFILLNAQAQDGESDLNWLTNLDEAVSQAQKTDKKILVYFSGSDWCRPCMLLRLEVFDKEIFKNLAQDSLVLVQFDFPAKAKNKLSDEQQKLNEKMAERFNKEGVFPKVLILDEDASVLSEINGYIQGGMVDIIKKITATL